MKGRHVSWSWRRSRATVGWQQRIVKKKPGACKQGKKEEAVVPHSPMDAASTPWGWRMRDGRSEPCSKNSSEESVKRSKRKGRPVAKMGPQEPGGRNEGALAGSAFDLAGYQDANGESGGGGYFNTPGNGPKTRGGSRTPRRQQQQHVDEIL